MKSPAYVPPRGGSEGDPIHETGGSEVLRSPGQLRAALAAGVAPVTMLTDEGRGADTDFSSPEPLDIGDEPLPPR